MPYESILASYFGAPMPNSEFIIPYKLWTVFNGFQTTNASLATTTANYKTFKVPVVYVDGTTGFVSKKDIDDFFGTSTFDLELYTDFTDASVNDTTFKQYVNGEVKTEVTSKGVEKYLEITALQRETPAGGAHPPQAWIGVSRSLVNGLPQAGIPELCIELDIELPKTLETSLVYPKSGSNNWFAFHEIKRGHGMDPVIGSPTYGTYQTGAGDARNNILIIKDEQTGLLSWVGRIDDGGNNASFTLPGVAGADDTKRVMREVFTPGANNFLGKRILVRIYQKNPANNADRTTGIYYITATIKDTGETVEIAKFIGGEQMGIYSLPYGRIYIGIYSGGNCPYSMKIFGIKFYDKYPLNKGIFNLPFRYEDGMCYIPLTNSLDVQKGYGMGTFARASTATVFDYIGKLVTVPINVPRFEGARYVQNLLASTDILSTQSVSVNAETYTFSFTGTGSISFSGAYAGSDLVGTGNTRVSRTFTPSAGTLTLTVTGLITNAQLEVGSNVSEYVSVGSSSIGYNYHGLEIDGIKAFSTDINGNPINPSILKGLLINSSARTNNLLWCRDLTNAVWVSTNITTNKNQTGIDGYNNTCTLLTATSANATILQTIVAAAVNASSSAYIKRVSGSGNIYFTRDGGSTWVNITAQINNSNFTRVKIENTSILDPQIGFKIETSGDSIVVDCAQNEVGAEVSMPMLTTTVAVTRNAETLIYPSVSNFNSLGWEPSTGIMLCTFEASNWNTATGSLLGGTTGGLFVSNSNSGVIAKDDTNTVNGPTGVPSGSMKLGLRYNVNTLEAMSNGNWSNVGTYSGDFGQGTSNLTWLRVGADVNGYIKNICLWSQALSNDRITEILS